MVVAPAVTAAGRALGHADHHPLSGHGGHVPAHGLGGPMLGPKDLPGVVLAAVATLPLGIVLGPEAPDGAGQRPRPARSAPVQEGCGAENRTGPRHRRFDRRDLHHPRWTRGGRRVGAGGGRNGGAQLFVLLLPCLVASGAGALVFTGFGQWTGLSIGALSLPEVPPDVTPDAADFLWGIPWRC